MRLFVSNASAMAYESRRYFSKRQALRRHAAEWGVRPRWYETNARLRKRIQAVLRNPPVTDDIQTLNHNASAMAYESRRSARGRLNQCQRDGLRIATVAIHKPCKGIKREPKK